MKTKKSLISLALGVGLTMALVALLDGPAAPIDAARAAPEEGNGTLTVEVLDGSEWRLVGEPAFDKFLTARQLDLSPLGLSGPIRVRIGHPGDTAAHIDAALLDGVAPGAVEGAAEGPELAVQKLAAAEYDVVHATGRTLTLDFEAPDGEAATLALTARSEGTSCGEERRSA